ncbi:MAG: hypothetical protein IMZ53_13715 [Thermoplasmata archaeon]|nr:hypothetical protein [Thermoplasmata archaeon]MBE3141628.1 hypothetical protein [Thermoplasmata archaeon]
MTILKNLIWSISIFTLVLLPLTGLAEATYFSIGDGTYELKLNYLPPEISDQMANNGFHLHSIRYSDKILYRGRILTLRNVARVIAIRWEHNITPKLSDNMTLDLNHSVHIYIYILYAKNSIGMTLFAEHGSITFIGNSTTPLFDDGMKINRKALWHNSFLTQTNLTNGTHVEGQYHKFIFKQPVKLWTELNYNFSMGNITVDMSGGIKLKS